MKGSTRGSRQRTWVSASVLVLFKSLGRGLPPTHWNPFPILDHDQLDFVTLFQTRQQKSLPSHRLAISMQNLHDFRSTTYANLTNILPKSLPNFDLFYRTPGKTPSSRLNYIYTGHFSGKLYLILDQNCLITVPYPKLNRLKTVPFTAAHTHLAYIWSTPAPGRGIQPLYLLLLLANNF